MVVLVDKSFRAFARASASIPLGYGGDARPVQLSSSSGTMATKRSFRLNRMSGGLRLHCGPSNTAQQRPEADADLAARDPRCLDLVRWAGATLFPPPSHDRKQSR